MTEPREAPHGPWLDLSFEDLEEWVGSTSLSRGHNYQKKKRVLLLACSPDGGLSGRVVGSSLYHTVVWRDAAGALLSVCSCPLGRDCKHAVAVVLEYLERAKAGKDILTELPTLPEERPTARAIGPPDDHEGAAAPKAPAKPPKPARGSRKPKKVSLEEYLRGLTAPELVSLVLELAATSGDLKRLLESRAALASGELDAVLRSLRKELARVSAEPGWRNSWDGRGRTPDYSQVTKHLESLLAAGQADVVLQLGLEIIAAGTEQVGRSDDEGDTAVAVAEALSPVWEALGRSSLSAAERILWLYDRHLDDEYELCDGADRRANVREVGPGVWNEVAEALLARLQTKGMQVVGRDDYGTHYDRDRVGRWASHALQEAGRKDEAVDLAAREASITGSYERAVDLLTEAGRQEEARLLALEGIQQTQSTFPGIAAQLRDRLRGLAGQEGNRALEAAFIAEEFFLRPSIEGFRNLREATQDCGLWASVREQTLTALQTGSSPLGRPDWPLPATGTSPEPQHPNAPAPRPQPGLLTEIALDEGDHAEALKWYRTASADRFGWGGPALAGQVAREVAKTHPDEAIAIWRNLAERHIGRGGRSGYEESLRYLRPMRRLLIQSKRQDEWAAYLLALRTEHRRKRALLATLDTLQDGPIIAS
jgi:uncharacterized Zn finger protein